MKAIVNWIAKEFLYLVLAIIVGIATSFLFIELVELQAQRVLMSESDVVVQMDLLIIGGLLGIFGFYLTRFTAWAIRKVVKHQREG